MDWSDSAAVPNASDPKPAPPKVLLADPISEENVRKVPVRHAASSPCRTVVPHEVGDGYGDDVEQGICRLFSRARGRRDGFRPGAGGTGCRQQADSPAVRTRRRGAFRDRSARTLVHARRRPLVQAQYRAPHAAAVCSRRGRRRPVRLHAWWRTAAQAFARSRLEPEIRHKSGWRSTRRRPPCACLTPGSNARRMAVS